MISRSTLYPPAPGARLHSVAASRPETTVTGAQLGEPFGKDAAWIATRTGIRALRRLAPDETLVSHAVDAGGKAIAEAALAPDQIDLLITATCSSNARPGATLGEQVADRLGVRARVMDVNAACAGFTYALAAADAQVRSGEAQHVLIIAAEQMSRILDPSDLGTSIIFGDGAAAAVVGACDEPGIGPTVWGSAGESRELIATQDCRLRMRGSEVFRWAVELSPQLVTAACERAGVSTRELDVLVLHQANLRIIDAAVRHLDLRDDVVIARDVIDSGNTSAASVPIALDALRRRGDVPGDALALLAGFGAGLAYAAQVVRLP